MLWGEILRLGFRIFFAHRTFQWNNEARGVAAVHCVIVGFAAGDHAPKRLFDYEDLRGQPHELAAVNINPYLVDAADVLLPNRSKPICDAPPLRFGNQPIDGGNLILTPEERNSIIANYPDAAPWIRPFLGADEYINGGERYCLWLEGISPTEIKKCPPVLQRIEAVRKFRLDSRREATRELASTPTQFAFVSHEPHRYIIVPSVSSERRAFIPIGFLGPEVIASNLCLIVPQATLYHFGVITSTMHMAWVRAVCGRLKSDYRYSAGIVYNNFPWPQLAVPSPSGRRCPEGADEGNANGKPPLPPAGEGNAKAAIEAAAQGVLDARAQFPDATLADLYDPLTMPPALVKAHAALDKAVDAAYVAAEKAAGRKPPKLGTDAERVAFLFQRYQALTGLLPAAPATTRRKKAPSA